MDKSTLQKIAEESLWEKLSDTLSQHLGLYFSKDHYKDLRRGIAAMAAYLRLSNAEECARRLLAAPLNQQQLHMLAKYLTVGETYFLRDPRIFEVLEKHILPELLHRHAKSKRLRIWSAACSTGEEAYSIAAILTRVMPDIHQWDIKLLATDITLESLKKASEGIYSEWSFRNVPERFKKDYFIPIAPGRYLISPILHRYVTFSYHNLIKDNYPSVENGTHAMDIIFCRNVLMYFDKPQIVKIILKLTQCLVEGGWLVLSPLDMPAQAVFPNLVPIHEHGVLLFRKDSTQEQTVLPISDIKKEMPSPKFQRRAEDKILAEPLFTETIEETPVPKAAPCVKTSEDFYFCSAKSLYAKGEYLQAIEQLHQELLSHPHHGEAMILMARSFANNGQLSTAQYWCEKALSINKIHAGWLYLLAAILEEQHLENEAEIVLRRALYLEQENPLLHFSLGNLLRKQGKTKAGEKCFLNALSILKTVDQEDIIPESDGITAAGLKELITAAMMIEVPHEY